MKATITPKLKDIVQTLWKGVYPHRFSGASIFILFFVAQLTYLFIPLYYKQFFDVLARGGVEPKTVTNELTPIVFVILGLNALGWALFRGGMLILNRFESDVMARLKDLSFDYVIRHSHTYFSNTFTGSIVQRINRLGRAFERIVDALIFSLIPIIIHTVGAAVIVWFQNRLVSMVIVVWVGIVFVLNLFFSRWKVKYDVASASADSATTGRLADAVGNHSAILTYAGESHESKGFHSLTKLQAIAQWRSWNFGAILDMSQSALFVIVEFLLFYIAIRYWESGLVTAGMFVMFQIYIISLGNRMWDFGRVIRAFYEGYSDSQEAVAMLLTPHEITDTKGALPLEVKGGEITITDLVFGYGDLPPVYDKLSLHIPSGQKIALVGHSGSGKSTFVKLLMRLHDQRGGVIAIDGQDIRLITQQSLRKAIAYVPQDPVLFHRTLLENIQYGRRDATEEETISAATLAHCSEFIEKLPKKYDTFVGERGVKLSGGERQRVAIARAILKKAPILILDEATSSLDSHSEALIQDAMNSLIKGKTTIVIAHRLSTIKMMDRILVFDKGKIVEDGTHDELLEKKGIYAELWSHQSGGYMTEE